MLFLLRSCGRGEGGPAQGWRVTRIVLLNTPVEQKMKRRHGVHCIYGRKKIITQKNKSSPNEMVYSFSKLLTLHVSQYLWRCSPTVVPRDKDITVQFYVKEKSPTMILIFFTRSSSLPSSPVIVTSQDLDTSCYWADSRFKKVKCLLWYVQPLFHTLATPPMTSTTHTTRFGFQLTSLSYPRTTVSEPRDILNTREMWSVYPGLR